jgi:hypothetical protein
MSETYLNDVWSVYFHDPYSNDWTTESYKMLGTVSTVEEFWQHYNISKENINKAIFFFMRDYVFPSWDDPSNLNGGCISIKVLKEHVADFFEDICLKLLGEILLKPEYRSKWNLINGVSTSPKKHFCIIKLWVKNDILSDKDMFDFISGFYGDILYKSNRENIQNDQLKRY